MRKLLTAALCLIATVAAAAPAFVGYNTPNGSIPVIFGATNVTAGDQIYFLGFTNSSGTATFTMNGAQTTMSNVPVVGPSPCTGGCLNFSDGHGDTFSLWAGLSAGTPPTVATPSQNTTSGVWTTGTNTYTADQPITISGCTAPGGFVIGTTYYVMSAGLSSTTIELTATQGSGILKTPTSSSSCTLNTIQQNFTVSQPSGDSMVSSWEIEFSGGVSTKSPIYTTTASPGGGTGAVVGQAVTVASGDILLVWAYDTDAFGNAPTVTTGAWSPTTINTNNSSIAVYIVGTGASITPTFNAAVGDLTTPHQVIQMIVSATSSGGSCTHGGYTSGGAIATPNGTTGSYVGKSGAFVTPDCSTVQYWQPALGAFGAT